MSSLNEILHACKYGDLNFIKNKFRNFTKNEIESLNDDSKASCIHYAARKGHIEILDYLINEKKVSSNLKSSVGATILHDAAINGRISVIEWILDNTDMDILARDLNGATVLHLASKYGQTRLIEWYLKRFGNEHANLKTNNGTTCLHFACACGCLKCVKMLAKAASETINMKTKFGLTPLYLAAQGNFIHIISLLVNNYNADWAIRDNDGMSLLHVSCQNGAFDVCKWLVETYNYDVNDKDYFGGTGLHYSCSNGHFKLATYLLKNNARILTDRFGGTPLHDAAANNQIECAKLLLKHNCDINVLDNNQLTAYQIAENNEFMQLAQIIKASENKNSDDYEKIDGIFVNKNIETTPAIEGLYSNTRRATKKSKSNSESNNEQHQNVEFRLKIERSPMNDEINGEQISYISSNLYDSIYEDPDGNNNNKDISVNLATSKDRFSSSSATEKVLNELDSILDTYDDCASYGVNSNSNTNLNGLSSETSSIDVVNRIGRQVSASETDSDHYYVASNQLTDILSDIKKKNEQINEAPLEQNVKSPPSPTKLDNKSSDSNKSDSQSSSWFPSPPLPEDCPVVLNENSHNEKLEDIKREGQSDDSSSPEDSFKVVFKSSRASMNFDLLDNKINENKVSSNRQDVQLNKNNFYSMQQLNSDEKDQKRDFVDELKNKVLNNNLKKVSTENKTIVFTSYGCSQNLIERKDTENVLRSEVNRNFLETNNIPKWKKQLMERKNQAQGNPVNNIASTFDNNKTRQINWLMELELRNKKHLIMKNPE